jgi:hypothetical protein
VKKHKQINDQLDDVLEDLRTQLLCQLGYKAKAIISNCLSTKLNWVLAELK